MAEPPGEPAQAPVARQWCAVTPDEPAEADDGPEALTIQQVSERLGVPAPTLRSWERRYGIPPTDRSQGGHRRYSTEQVAMVREMRDHVAAGKRASDAAAVVQAEAHLAPETLVEDFVHAASTLVPTAVLDVLDTAGRVLGLERTVDEVLFPALRVVGERWASGLTGVAEEHLASHATQTWLVRMAQHGPALRPGLPIIMCCAPTDHHTLGLEALGALLRGQGWDCRTLGARTPADSLVRAVQAVSAGAVIMACHLPAGRSAAVEALRSPGLDGVTLFYAGGAFATRQARQGVPGHYLGGRMGDAVALVTETLSAAA